MIVNIVKKKASSLKELGYQQIDIPKVKTLKELLIALCVHEYDSLYQTNKLNLLTSKDIEVQARLGRVKFTALYNKETVDINQAINVMLQDYQDGLFRVYLDGMECKELDANIKIEDNAKIVLIRLVMLAGRLW